MNKNMFTGDQLAKIKALADRNERGHTPSRRSRRRQKEGKHTRISRTNDGRRFTWHETKPLPEDVKAKNRQKNKAKKKQLKKVRNR